VVSEVYMDKLRKRPNIEVGWTLLRIGPYHLDQLQQDDSNPKSISDLIPHVIAKCGKRVLLIFQHQRRSEYRREEHKQKMVGELVLDDDTNEIGGTLLGSTVEQNENVPCTRVPCEILQDKGPKPQRISTLLPSEESLYSISTWLPSREIFTWIKTKFVKGHQTKIRHNDYKLWLGLNEDHKLLVDKEEASKLNIIEKLITMFHNEQLVMSKHQIHVGDQLSCGDDAKKMAESRKPTCSWVVRRSILHTGRKSQLAKNLPVLGEEQLIINPSSDGSSLSTWESNCISEDNWDNLSHMTKISTIADARKFDYPFVASVNRLSELGLELEGMNPLKFLEHEVNYVQASLEAQETITGEPFDITCEDGIPPGWKCCYADGTSKVFWMRDDGVIKLDPPDEEFWILLANPLSPLNPFEYAC